MNARTYAPNRPTWSIVWFAPVPRSKGGRSAVSSTSVARDGDASTTAGRSSAAAVPLVHATATGRPVAFARPSAKNAEARSSRWTCSRTSGCRASASASGVDRDPGETVSVFHADRTSSFTTRQAHARATLGFARSAHPREPQPEREQQPERRVHRRRPRQHRDQLPARRGTDRLDRPDRDGHSRRVRTAPTAGARSRREASTTDAEHDRDECRDHARAIHHSGPRSPSRTASVRLPPQRPSGCRAGCSRRASRRRAIPSPPRAHHAPQGPSRPGRTRSRTSPSARRTEHHDLAEAESGVRTRPSAVQQRGQQREGAHDQERPAPSRARARGRRRRRRTETQRRDQHRTGRPRPASVRRGGPTRSGVSTPRTPSK